MPNKNYLRGRRLEYKVKDDLEKQGWTVMRTAGSHGFADLIALKGDKIRFIQCKTIATEKGSAAKINKLKKDVVDKFPPSGLARIEHELVVKINNIKEIQVYYGA